MRRSAVAMIGSVGALVIACSTYGSHDDPSPADASSGDAAIDTAAFAPVDAGGDVVERDGAIDRDAGCTDPCDCDGDTFKNTTCETDATKADCDDSDPLVHPGQGYVATKWDDKSPHQPPGDWDCDGKVQKQFAENLDCGQLSLNPNCATAEGFADTPACGEQAMYRFCKSVSLACNTDRVETRKQACK